MILLYYIFSFQFKENNTRDMTYVYLSVCFSVYTLVCLFVPSLYVRPSVQWSVGQYKGMNALLCFTDRMMLYWQSDDKRMCVCISVYILYLNTIYITIQTPKSVIKYYWISLIICLSGWLFLDASSHLHSWVCPSVLLSIIWYVSRSDHRNKGDVLE